MLLCSTKVHNMKDDGHASLQSRLTRLPGRFLVFHLLTPKSIRYLDMIHTRQALVNIFFNSGHISMR